MNAISGENPGQVIHPTWTLTLALPKIGLGRVEGRVFLADFGIHPELYAVLGIRISPLFNGQYMIELDPGKQEAYARGFVSRLTPFLYNPCREPTRARRLPHPTG